MAQTTSSYSILRKHFNKFIEVRRYIMECNFEVLNIDEIEPMDWRMDILEFLRNPSSNHDRKLKYKTLFYTVLGDELYKQLSDGTLARCLSKTEA